MTEKLLALGDGDEWRSAIDQKAKVECLALCWTRLEQTLGRSVQAKPQLKQLLNDSGLLG